MRTSVHVAAEGGDSAERSSWVLARPLEKLFIVNVDIVEVYECERVWNGS